MFITSLFGDRQLGGDTTYLAGMIAENLTLKHGFREQSAQSVRDRVISVLPYLDRILTELRQLLELGTIITIVMWAATLNILAFREQPVTAPQAAGV